MSHPDKAQAATIDAAVARLAAGELVAFPTETVYGLGADAGNPDAVARIFAAKGRPADHPVIVHVAAAEDIPYFARAVPPAAWRLAQRLWPGPLTLVLPRSARVDDVVTGGQDTVGLRCPAHPLARALLQACREAGIRGLAAPSANRFGRLSPTTAAHVRAEFGPEVMVLDGGRCEVGIESTIVAFTDGQPRILRPGMCPAETIVAIAGVPLADGEARAPRVSGSLAQHYAPSTPLELLGSAELLARVRALSAERRRVAVFAGAATLACLDVGAAGLQVRTAATEPAAYAHELYVVLHELDAADAEILLVERPPDEPGWEAIHDRLARAAAGSGSAS